jgi:hypothetical protein
MAWQGYFGCIIFACYIGAIVASAFSQKLSVTLIMIYFCGLLVVVLGWMAWFAIMLVASDPVGIAITVAGTIVGTLVIGLILGVIERNKWKR